MATIAENLQTIIDIKADIKTAIENKGVTVGDAGFGEYAGKIDSIEGGSASIDVGALGIKLGNSTFTEVPDGLDFSNLNDVTCMFENCFTLTTVPLFDTSNITSMYGMFRGCESLTSIPLFDTSNVTDMQEIFRNCSSITTIPQLNTSKVNSMREAFFNCDELITLPEFDCSGFNGKGLQGLSIVGDTHVPLQNIGGFKDLGKGFVANGYYSFISLGTLFDLTYESCMNVINKVYDMNLNTEYTVNPRIVFSATSYDLLSEDDIAIATSKGWTVQRS